MPTFPFVTRPTNLNVDRCLNRKHYQADCTCCGDVCPTHAITVSDRGEIGMTPEACLGCGLCLHVCPTEVFATNRWSERTPLANVSDRQVERIDVYCVRHPDASIGARGNRSVQIPTCLAAMSPGIWFELGLKHVVQVRLEACAGCPLECTTNGVERSVETANVWLHDAGYEPHITCTHATDDAIPTTRRPVIDGEHVQVSRRGFFRSLFGAASRDRQNPTVSQELIWTGDQSPKRQPHLPSWMAHAAQAYAQNSHPSAEPTALWPSITIGSACTHCNACTHYCPTGALKADVSTDSYTITFNPGQCVDCRICWASCPVGAITRSQQPTTEPFARRAVLQCPASRCVHCGQPAEPGSDVCYWCAEEPPLASIVTDARRWLFTAPAVLSADPAL